ncbi:hypothetical protein KKA00_06685, partial [bacterium]|nr:hypothetical protein [bacterium]
MRQITTGFALLLLIMLAFTTVQALDQKEIELQAFRSATDAAPNIGPVVKSNPVDDQWDLFYSFNAGLAAPDNQLLGAEFAQDWFFATGGGNAGEPNYLYKFDRDGVLVTAIAQWSSAGWGWRDLAYDGAYLYGSDDLTVDAFDLDGNPVSAMNISGPVSPCRALAYDPVTDHFWTASFSSPLYEFDRAGNVIWSGSSTLAGVYGAAWDGAAPDGPWLWLHDQSGTPSTTFHQFDPINYVMTGFSYTVPLLPGSTDQMAGGAFFTDEYDAGWHLLGGMTQGTPDDQIFLLEMYVAGDPLAPAAPTNFTVTPDAGGALSIDLAWDLPTTTISGEPISLYPITSVEVMRDGVPHASLAATATSYADAVPAAGSYDYSVYCVNSYGNGIPANGSGWAGLDVPAGVENLTGQGVGTDLVAELTWDNPTMGMHGGYFPAGSIDGYTINRYGASTATFDLAGLNTSYTDDTIPLQGWYYYGVIPYNASGDGPEMMTDEFYVGPPAFEEIPYDWIEINPSHPDFDYPGTNSGIVSDDQNVGPFDIGMNFPWY